MLKVFKGLKPFYPKEAGEIEFKKFQKDMCKLVYSLDTAYVPEVHAIAWMRFIEGDENFNIGSDEQTYKLQ